MLAEAAELEVNSTISTDSVWSLGVGGVPVVGEGPVALAVDRDLGCSGGGDRNQTKHTSWNCLRSRRINGSEIRVAAGLQVNGVAVFPLPSPGVLV
jgi:hypothetical protein